MKQIFLVLFLFILSSCGSNTTTPEEQNLEVNTTDNNQTEEINENSTQNNVSIEDNTTSYTDEVLTLVADSAYTTNNSSTINSAKIITLSFKGILPLVNNTPIVKAENNFTIELTWQNPEYAKNINYYFFNGSQRSIQYLSFPLAEGASSYQLTCQMLGMYRYKCAGLTINDEKYYEGRSFPIRSSFVMSLCDRNTQDPNRICDFIRIPVELRK